MSYYQMQYSQTGIQQEVYTKYSPKEELRFTFTIVKDQHSLICGAKAYKLTSNTLNSYNSIGGLVTALWHIVV